MKPDKIKIVEETFATNYTDSNGTRHSLVNTIDLGDGISIKQIRPKYNTYYYTTETKKTAICLHFTVGNTKGDIGSLTKQNNYVSVNYVVDRLGNIYNLFDDKFWSYHLGAGTIGTNAVMSKQTIGIEVSSYGPLKLVGDEMIDAYGNVYCKKSEKEFYTECKYRGYDYYTTMTDKQEAAIAKLIKYLCKENDIPEVFKKNPDEVFKDAAEAKKFTGIFYHTSVRKDKFDWPDALMTGVKNKLVERKVVEAAKPQVCKDPAFNVKYQYKPSSTINNSLSIVPQQKSFIDTIIEFISNIFKK